MTDKSDEQTHGASDLELPAEQAGEVKGGLKESARRGAAHNASGEESKGLWQINGRS